MFFKVLAIAYEFYEYILFQIQAVFSLEVSELEKQLTALSADKKNMSLPLIPSYLVILSTFDSTELANYFKQFLVVLSMSGTSISWLQIAANILCAREQTQEYVLSSLWDGSCLFLFYISFLLLSLIVLINSFKMKIS